MKTLLSSIKELLLEVFGGRDDVKKLNDKLDAVLVSLDLIIANQASLAVYLGMQEGVGATPEELTALGNRIKAARKQLVDFDEQTHA